MPYSVTMQIQRTSGQALHHEVALLQDGPVEMDPEGIPEIAPGLEG